MDQNNRTLEQQDGEKATDAAEKAPADSSEDPATTEDFEEEDMGIAPKE